MRSEKREREKGRRFLPADRSNPIAPWNRLLDGVRFRVNAPPTQKSSIVRQVRFGLSTAGEALVVWTWMGEAHCMNHCTAA